MQRAPWSSADGVYIIAEIGGNHEGNFEYALELTRLACASGADCIKYQVYTGDSLVSRVESPDRNAHFKKFQLTHEQYEQVAELCRKHGKHFGASVWDPDSIEWAAGLVPFFKIGSGDLTAYPILARLAATRMPLMLSTGLATLEEVHETVSFLSACDPIYREGTHLSILQCTSMYPIPPADANLRVLRTLQSEFPQYSVGYSDHTTGRLAVEVAVAVGAEILEVHFTDERDGKTFRDHKVSLMRDEVRELRERLVSIRTLLGAPEKRPAPSEVDSGHIVSFRRAVYLNRDLAAGEVVRESDITALRPNHGIDAREWRRLVGATARAPISAYARLTWDDFECVSP